MDVQNRWVMKTWSLNFSGREAILDRVPAFARELIDTIRRKEEFVQATPEAAAAPVSSRPFHAALHSPAGFCSSTSVLTTAPRTS